MLKNILNLEGAQKLTKNEQKSINGGKSYVPACAEGGFLSSRESCPTSIGYVWEIATSCCYYIG